MNLVNPENPVNPVKDLLVAEAFDGIEFGSFARGPYAED